MGFLHQAIPTTNQIFEQEFQLATSFKLPEDRFICIPEIIPFNKRAPPFSG